MQSQQHSIDEKQVEEEPTTNTPTIEPKPISIPEAEVKTPINTQPVDIVQEIKTTESPLAKPELTNAFSDDVFEDDFDFGQDLTPTEPEPPSVDIIEKPKLSEKEIKLLRLQLENAEYLQLKSLLQAKINSEQFEIVKLRSHVALKSKQESAVNVAKENKDNYTPDEQELRQRLMKENALLEQKRISLANQIFQERVACIQLKIELAMKEIL